MDLPIENGDFHSYVSLPEGSSILGHKKSSIFGMISKDAKGSFEAKLLRAPAKAWLKEVTGVLRVPANAATALGWLLGWLKDLGGNCFIEILVFDSFDHQNLYTATPFASMG